MRIVSLAHGSHDIYILLLFLLKNNKNKFEMLSSTVLFGALRVSSCSVRACVCVCCQVPYPIVRLR